MPSSTSPARSAPRRLPKAGSDPAAAVVMLLEAHGPRVRAAALRLCRNRADADDAVQDTFLQAFAKWHTFKGEADPGTWLYAIAVRTCTARWRRDARGGERGGKGGSSRRMPALSQLMPWQETTVMQAAAAPVDEVPEPERHEAVARVQAEIARLPEHLRVVTILKEVLELSVQDTARTLGLAENTVKTRLHRARLALRKAMTAKAAAVEAPTPIFEKQVCLDLLKAKMDAMDRGGVHAGFAVPQAELCARCRAVFRELDMVQDACSQLGAGDLPAKVRQAVLAGLRQAEAEAGRLGRPRRGRPPRRAGGGVAKRTGGRG
ncbi:MAG: RNA polymerase sigma factor [Planctomycetaceae bacterium]|jgi:RNA polymerase sigma-70 factor (ECF subfamily)|nr:RNA polymerase sigma factor [Phycisphaerales bacterium]MCE2652779.1 RNA polymerase sigma factor [Planctomycetaceae bacterium]